MSKNLQKIVERAKEQITEHGNFSAALLKSTKEVLLIKDFIDEFAKNKNPDKEDLKLAKQILKIGKSFFEFGYHVGDEPLLDGKIQLVPKNPKMVLTPQFISDEYYTKLKVAYRKFDDEPMAYIPSGRDKIEIKDPRLANNLEKCYRAFESEDVPKGVSERGSIEEMLNSAYETLGLSKSDKMTVIFSPKIDGASVNHEVRKGRVKNAATRGDKKSGVHIKGLEGLEMADKSFPNLNVQMEAFLTDEQIKELESILGKTYVNNRSSISGVINSLSQTNLDEVERIVKNVSFYPIESSSNLKYVERLKELDRIAVVPKDMIKRVMFNGNKKEILAKAKEIRKEWGDMRKDLSYAIDGVVITIADDKYQKKLGRTGSTNNYQIAYKFDPETQVGIADHISLSSGLKGFRSIILHLKKPVTIDGVTYDHAKIKSLKEFEELGVCYGDEVVIVRAGDTVPAFTINDECKRSANGVKLTVPELCPRCMNAVVIVDKKHKCVNPQCAGNIEGSLVNFFNVIGLDGYGEDFARVLVEGGIKRLYDLLELDEEKLKAMGFKSKAENFPKDLSSKLAKIKDFKLIEAIGLEKIGEVAAYAVSKIAPIPELLLMKTYSIESALYQMDGFGSKSAKDISEQIDGARTTLRRFYPHIDQARMDYEAVKIVGFTGGEASNKVKKLIESLGWKITSGKTFDILITSSYDRDKPKNKTAKDKGLPIYTEEDFLKNFGK